MAATEQFQLKWVALLTEGGIRHIHSPEAAPKFLFELAPEEDKHAQYARDYTAELLSRPAKPEHNVTKKLSNYEPKPSTASVLYNGNYNAIHQVEDLFYLFHRFEINLGNYEPALFGTYEEPTDPTKIPEARWMYSRTLMMRDKTGINATFARLTARRNKRVKDEVAQVQANKGHKHEILPWPEALKPQSVQVEDMESIPDFVRTQGRISVIEVPHDKSMANIRGTLVGFRTLTDNDRPIIMMMSYDTVDVADADLGKLRSALTQHINGERSKIATAARKLAAQVTDYLPSEIYTMLTDAKAKAPALRPITVAAAPAPVAISAPVPVVTAKAPTEAPKKWSAALEALAGTDAAMPAPQPAKMAPLEMEPNRAIQIKASPDFDRALKIPALAPTHGEKPLAAVTKTAQIERAASVDTPIRQGLPITPLPEDYPVDIDGEISGMLALELTSQAPAKVESAVRTAHAEAAEPVVESLDALISADERANRPGAPQAAQQKAGWLSRWGIRRNP